MEFFFTSLNRSKLFVRHKQIITPKPIENIFAKKHIRLLNQQNIKIYNNELTCDLIELLPTSVEAEILEYRENEIKIYLKINTSDFSWFKEISLSLACEKSRKKSISFVEQVKGILTKNINDENFGILQLCKSIGLSRSQLHNKIKTKTGLSTSIFIRSIRLEKAKKLLEQTELNVSEVAYEVGFKDPSYFSRLFLEKYNLTPSKYRTHFKR